ncbi:acryloyl-CoA reductase electron transfer subunit gamma [Ruminiclostridium hungatei]|uniref:Electron transfer flavoprotein small subunit n=1 Tax=Ruminiclostridium hungatei TaxID=48256 RepID=A0A1V4SMZ0_RUMHU|nr:electron transfer flavoprotein subunit beta/FixA family protein [Ruminiclostridium hungatei]OPX45230.1 acryloyl-CoA reductase electron transfer subunit gamma [Ruminiclostridium hungatei]
MRTIVCIKQVPETNEVKIDSENNSLIREKSNMAINPVDMYALEEAIQLSRVSGGSSTAMSMGIPEVSELLRNAIGLGIDEAVLLSDIAFAGADTLATAYALSMGIKKLGDYDLIICGRNSADGDTGQVGPSLAEKLGIPHITCVNRIIETESDYIRCSRLSENGYEIVEMSLPGLITVVKGINEPRLPSLARMMKARKADIPILTARDIDADIKLCGFTGSPTKVVSTHIPLKETNIEMFTGSEEEQAQLLIERLNRLL